MLREQFTKLLQIKNINTLSQKAYMQKHHKNIYENINLHITKHDLNNKNKFSNLVYLWYYNLKNEPICDVCNTTILNFYNFNIGYGKNCSIKCAANSKSRKKKIKQTNLKRYGCEHAAQSKEIQDKIKQTNLKRYGVENPMQCEKIREKTKQTNVKRYGCEHATQSKQIQEKTKQTNLKRYGVENPMQCEKIRVKTKQTNLKKYGVEHTFQVDEFKKKSTETMLNKYGIKYSMQSKELRQKAKVTMLKNHGVEYPIQSKEIQKKTKRTNLEKYGVEYGWNNMTQKQTMLTRYGVLYSLQSQYILQKVKETMLNIYGVEYPMQSEELQKKIKQTNLERYGCEYQIQSDIVKNKIKETNKQKFFDKYSNDINIVDVNYENRILMYKCDNCKQISEIDCTLHNLRKFRYNVDPCINCNPISKFDGYEKKIRSFLDELNIEYEIRNRQCIKPKELDIYISKYNLAIECNGVFWHCELYRDKNYHLDKYTMCKNANIKLIQIWEDDWHLKQEIIKNRLKGIFNLNKKLYATECIVTEISTNDYRIFLETNHLNSYIATKIKIGLLYDNELVSVIGFKEVENGYELYRYCESKRVIIGGLAKMFEYFVQKYKPNKVIVYQDLDWDYNEIYAKLGFVLEKQTDPDYSYLIKGIRESRFNYTKEILVQQGFNSNKTEAEIMFERKIYKIWNTGNEKWTWTKN